MRLMMTLGGMIGFIIGVGFGVTQGNAWPVVLWHAAVAAYVAGLLMRWWGRIWFRSLKEVQQARQASEPAASPEEIGSR